MPTLGVSSRWVKRRKPAWENLESLLDACRQRGVASLTHPQLRTLALLYRQTAADLSVARDDPASAALARYLNALVGRAHHLLYSGDRPRGRGIVGFYRHVFPAVFRDTLPFTLAAVAIFGLGLLAGAAMTSADAGFPRLIVSGAMLDTIESGHMWTHSIIGIKPLASSQIMTNNLTVSFAAFAGGILAGLVPVYMMLFNGLLIGTIAVACARADMSLAFWSFVAPHGVLELPAIFIAGGAGLLLGKGLLVPGMLPRKDSLTRTARQAVQLVLGVVPLLIVAGLIEAFVSPSDIPVPAKFAVAVAGLTLLTAYLARGARSEQVALLDPQIPIDQAARQTG